MHNARMCHVQVYGGPAAMGRPPTLAELAQPLVDMGFGAQQSEDAVRRCVVGQTKMTAVVSHWMPQKQAGDLYRGF